MKKRKKTDPRGRIALAVLLGFALLFFIAQKARGPRLLDPVPRGTDGGKYDWMAVLVFDGETRTRYTLQKRSEWMPVYNYLHSIPAEAAEAPAELTGPRYAFSSGEDGASCGSWQNGWWTAYDGTTYRLDLSEARLKKLLGQPKEAWDWTWDGVHAAKLARANGKWEISLLTPARDRALFPVEATLQSYGLRALRALVKNPTGSTRKYDANAYLEVLLEGAWYEVPERIRYDLAMAGSLTISAGGVVRSGASWNRLADNYNWDDLPAATYRLRWLGMEFPLEK